MQETALSSKKCYYPHTRASGEIEDTSALGADTARCGGASPLSPTTDSKTNACFGFVNMLVREDLQDYAGTHSPEWVAWSWSGGRKLWRQFSERLTEPSRPPSTDYLNSMF